MNESRILGCITSHGFRTGRRYRKTNLVIFFRTFLCNVLYSKNKSIDISHIVGYHLEFLSYSQDWLLLFSKSRRFLC